MISTFVSFPVVIVDDHILEQKLKSLVEVLAHSKVVCEPSKARIESRRRANLANVINDTKVGLVQVSLNLMTGDFFYQCFYPLLHLR